MQEPDGHHFCLLAHNVVNKLSAIIGHCEMLDIDAHEPQCIERLHKIRELASSTAAMLQSRECENAAVMRILELENAFGSGNRQPPRAEMPTNRRQKQA